MTLTQKKKAVQGVLSKKKMVVDHNCQKCDSKQKMEIDFIKESNTCKACNTVYQIDEKTWDIFYEQIKAFTKSFK